MLNYQVSYLNDFYKQLHSFIFLTKDERVEKVDEMDVIRERERKRKVSNARDAKR